MASAYDYYKDLPGWGKGLIAAGVAYGAWQLKSKLDNIEQNRKAAEATKRVDTELAKELEKKPLTYPISQYQTWANQLQDYMIGSGTDRNGILSVFEKLKNNSDYLQLYKSFGTRKYEYLWFDYGKKTLPQWLAIEDSWMEYLVYWVNETLKKKGIKYRV